MDEKAEIFKALSDPTRLRLMNIFLATGDDLCVCEMTDALQLPQYQISRHLATLRHAKLLKTQKQGTWTYYGLDQSQTGNENLFQFLQSYLQGGHFDEDRQRLTQRLILRDAGKCVVGIVPADELKQMIVEKLRQDA